MILIRLRARSALTDAFTIYAVSLAALLGFVIYAQEFVHNPNPPGDPSQFKVGILNGMSAWDGEWYKRIATGGYTYSQTEMSSVVFFPAFPMLAKGVMTLTRLSPEAALLIVANGFLLASMIAFVAYLDAGVIKSKQSVKYYALLSLALLPSTFYFRMAYTESMLLFLAVIVMYGMRRSWPPIVIALIIGMATATRSVGVALLAPFALHLWKPSYAERQPSGRHSAIDVSSAAPAWIWLRRLLLMSLACWGLFAFMAYQAWAFRDPFAFAKAQMVWRERALPDDMLQRSIDLISLEPVRSVYSPSSSCYWANRPPQNSALLNLQFANPIFFLGSVILISLGAIKGWLGRGEWLLAAMMLLIPYVVQANRMCMTSQARFASVVFPTYIVLGHLLARSPTLLAICLLSFSASLMGAYAALFTSWYPFF